MISATIVTYNEADKLRACLESIEGLADEIIVVDLGSTDATKKIATSFGCKIIPYSFVAYVELARNFAIEKCTGDWILVLDPDEQIPVSLKDYLREYAKTHTSGVLDIPRMNIFFGEWIKHTNFWPDYQIRFFSKGTVKWKPLLHSYPETTILPTKLPKLKKYAITHVSYPTFDSFIKKQNRYASIRARERYEDGDSASLISLGYLISREFLSRYIKHKGFLDKKRGLYLMGGLIYYLCAAEWKLKKMKK